MLKIFTKLQPLSTIKIPTKTPSRTLTYILTPSLFVFAFYQYWNKKIIKSPFDDNPKYEMVEKKQENTLVAIVKYVFRFV